MNLKKKSLNTTPITYSYYKSKKDIQITIKKLYLKDPKAANDEKICFLNKDYLLTVEKEEFLIFFEHFQAREALSNRFDVLEENCFTNLKKSKNFLWAIEQHKKTKTQKNSKTNRAAEMLERWVSVFSYYLYLQVTLKPSDVSNYEKYHRNRLLNTVLRVLTRYDYENRIEFEDLEIIEKMLENRDDNSLNKFIHDKIGIQRKYEYLEDPYGLKRQIRFNYLDD